MSHAPAVKPAAPYAGYEQDLHAWAIEQARLLRAGLVGQIDIENIAEEIFALAGSEYDKLESALEVLLMHMLKWDFQPERRSRSWGLTIAEQRKRAERQLRKNPSLKSRRKEAVDEAYDYSRLRAAREIDIEPSEFPEVCPYDWDAVLTRKFTLSD